jgi:CBS domain-containing protein
MCLRDVVDRKVAVVGPDTPLREIARRISSPRVSMVLVCNRSRFLGLITSRDLIVRATAQGRDPRTTTAQDVMAREIICVREDQALDEAASVMQQHRLSQMPVVDRHHRLVGVVRFERLQKKR